MSGNRKVTDFFKRSLTQTGQIHRAGSGADCINVARPSRAARSGSETAGDVIDEEARPEDISSLPPRVSRSDARRVVRHGKVVIKSSDDEGEDSSSSLESLDDLLGISTRLVGSPSDPQRDQQRRDTDKWASPILVTPKYKFSLGSLLDQTEKDAAAEAGISEARALLALPDPGGLGAQHSSNATKLDPQVGTLDGDENVGKHLLASVVAEQGNHGGLQKIMHAMNRTEALHRTKAWHFFVQRPESDAQEHRPFPQDCIPSAGWQAMLRDPSLRQQAFLTGFAAEMVAEQGFLHDEIISWLLDECLQHTPLQPSTTYFTNEAHFIVSSFLPPSSKVAKSAAAEQRQSSPHQIYDLLDSARISRLFRMLGGSEQAVDLKSVIQPVSQLPSGENPALSVPGCQLTEVALRVVDWARVLLVVQMLEQVAPHLSIEVSEHAFCMLGRLTADTALVHAADVLGAIGRAYTSLADSIPEDTWEESMIRIGEVVLGYLTYPPLRLQLLHCMPIHTTRMQWFRRRLALAFFSEDSSYLRKPQDSLVNIPRLTQLLQGSRFDIHPNTDYANLTALISILDMGLGNGTSGSQPLKPEDEKTFNRDIDALAAKIKTLFTQIVDTGASHMTRTEAKELLNRVYYRLIYAVRTKAQPKKNIFFSATSSSSPSSSFSSSAVAAAVATEESTRTTTTTTTTTGLPLYQGPLRKSLFSASSTSSSAKPKT